METLSNIVRLRQPADPEAEELKDQVEQPEEATPVDAYRERSARRYDRAGLTYHATRLT